MDDPRSTERREALRLMGRLVTIAPIAAMAAGCGLEARPAAPPAVARLPLESLPVGGRTTIRIGERPIEVRRDAAGVAARLLRCTHQGCDVRWIEPGGYYQCLCHDGRFDAEGQPTAGPPSRPMKDVPARIEGAEIVVGEGMPA